MSNDTTPTSTNVISKITPFFPFYSFVRIWSVLHMQKALGGCGGGGGCINITAECGRSSSIGQFLKYGVDAFCH